MKTEKKTNKQIEKPQNLLPFDHHPVRPSLGIAKIKF